ncbi:MAG: aminotransferase class V-fold PLP-dependent enzyme, partial [Desulfurococcales archaeon]|nr:aminotransferase class V-fold PLP-dependent enzyme [Desulfurococcales archaeon]
SSIGGVEIKVGGRGIDFLIGGSQKVLNMPSGLTIVVVSKKAWDAIEDRNYRGFYLNLKLWRDMLDGEGVFPYTMSDSLIYALNESLDMIMEEGEENVYLRHKAAQRASWKAVEALDLEPYPSSIEDSSPTVTAIMVPRGVSESELRRAMWEKHGIMIAGSWGRLEGKIIRVGHMGVQASKTKLIATYTALASVLKDRGLQVDVGSVANAIEEGFKPS